MVSDLDDAIHGEINVLQSQEEATRLVETLLESGFEQERIRIFVGDEMQMEVRHRPVVSLSTTDTGRTSKEDTPPAKAPEAPDSQEEEPVTVSARARSLHFEEVAAEPFIKNGVRFSSLFRAG
jgi:hypothetical protein